ncbi:GGDEF domain-containing protein [Leptospira ilyithenensis]|uniref:diguanylate cyclase n=1 Tax=Leptospira ilyithenensis TaxID=2484901 RepID=A0A4R9LN19_9LEPT|nr:GGDEF domain-containing protein [Leptospira ilyithenensis]TGN08384.1 GGDEF domain-containing protein [Leptospira ilyithenensis]
MRRYSFRRAIFIFRRLFLRTYHPTFIATNISDIRSSVMIFGVLSAFTSVVSLLFVDSLVRTKEASFWIVFFRISALLICFSCYLLAKKRIRFFERHIFSFTGFFIASLILVYIPMMVYDKPNHSYYLFGSAIVIASSAIILWIEPIRIFALSILFLCLFIPLHLNFSQILGFDRFVFYQDILIVSFLLGVGLTANLMINYWRFEEYRSKIRLRVTVGKLLRINQKIHDLSRIDSMTDLFNRRHLLEQFDLYKKRSKREGFCIGLVILDLDRLKHINDKYGHKQGDLAIQAFGKTLRSRVRSTDIAARIGGDEFCILGSPIDPIGLETLTESIREKIEILRIPVYNRAGETIQITVSIGATIFSPTEDPSFDELYHKIDTALYTSKNEGRNRITILPPSDSLPV